MRERDIEAVFVRKVREAGGLCFKFMSPGNTGVPDRIVILPGGRVVFAELKTEEGRLSRIQRWQIGRLRKLGADVRVLYGQRQVEDFVKEVTQG